MKLAKLQKKITLAMYKIYRDVCFQKGWQLNEHKHNPPSWELIAPKNHSCTQKDAQKQRLIVTAGTNGSSKTIRTEKLPSPE